MAKYECEFKPIAVIKLHRINRLSIIQFLPPSFDRPLILILSFLLRHLSDHLSKLILIEKSHVIMPLRLPICRRIVGIMITVYYNIMSLYIYTYIYKIWIWHNAQNPLPRGHCLFLSDWELRSWLFPSSIIFCPSTSNVVCSLLVSREFRRSQLNAINTSKIPTTEIELIIL